ncbi:MAG TPA: RagB/SusD family nutrient uptake outer membrane protein [Porphyromonadaceae bacterium]|nr:RagB/SusD family nutrient uptake outer membrane protein [Porphyromonadaceae bacterium]
MKNLGLIVTFVTLLCVNYSCSLDEPSYGKTTTENFYKKESDIDYALTGAYLQLRNTWNEYALNFYLLGDCTTDDALKGGGDDGDRREVLDLSNFIVYTTNAEVARRWTILYELINRCNDVIQYAPDAIGDADRLTRYANEAKALRAFGYYSLVTTFGGVPLITKPMTPAEILKVPRADIAAVYQLIETDLMDAASNLPAKSQYSEKDAYRVTRGFAKVMLAKSYMFRSDFENAEKWLKEVVEVDKDYELLPDYGLNWTPAYENSRESVFEIAAKLYDKNIATGTNVPHFFTSRNVSGYQGYGFHVPTQDLYTAFDADDPRITYVFTRTGDRYAGDTEDQDNSQSVTGYHDYKMTVPRVEKEGYDVWMIPYNIRMIRYADVLLLYAEALNENGKASNALVYVNKIRERARNTNPVDPRRSKQAYIPPTTNNTLPDITATGQMELRQAIWHERRCELAMEGWRRDDLMRQKRFGETMRAYADKYNTAKGANFTDSRDYLLPIPQDEIDKSNNVLTQNEGY